MKKISSIIQHFKSNPLTRLEKTLLKIILFVFCVCLLTLLFIRNENITNKNLISLEKRVQKLQEKQIKEQQKEIEKLKKDVVLHTILADSSIAKANRLSKKQINNEVAFSKIDSIVNNLSVEQINEFRNNRKSK